MTPEELAEKQKLCIHVVFPLDKTERPYRYQCRKCGKKQKILNGILMAEAPAKG